jgi:hypothetical protein
MIKDQIRDRLTMLAMLLRIIRPTIQIQLQAKKIMQKIAMRSMKRISKTVVRFGKDDITIIILMRCRMGRRAPFPVKRGRGTKMRNTTMIMKRGIQRTETMMKIRFKNI